MNWRVHVLVIAVPLTVAAAFALAADDATVTLECTNVPTAPQCPSGTSGGLLISQTDTRKDRAIKRTLTFRGVDNSFKEVMVFRRDRAPAYKQVTWTAAETLTFEGGHVELPLRIWAICTDEQGTCPTLTSARRTKLEKMVANANSALIRERTGIKLVPPADGMLISDESGTSELTVLKAVKACATFKVLAKPLRFAKGALNIYIVHTLEVDGTPQSNFGDQCGDGVAVVGATGNWALILHEIGHMLALRHVPTSASNWGSDPEANFMFDESDTRKFFTEGQIFRMHLGWSSVIHVLLNRYPNDKRACDPSSPGLPCPKPNERVWADQ